MMERPGRIAGKLQNNFNDLKGEIMLNRIIYPVRLIMIFIFIIIIINVSAENPTSENYIIKQLNFASGNDPADPPASANYILKGSSIDVISGEEAVSVNYNILPGYYHGEITGGIQPPENVTISVVGINVQLSWDPVPDAASYKVYSSDDPLTGFEEDTSGTFAGESWNAPAPPEKKFYYVKSVN